MGEQIFTHEKMERIHQSFDGSIEVVMVDLHGMTVNEAIKFIRNVIALNFRKSFTLVAIHGYNGGTAILEALRTKNLSDRVYNVSTCIWNPGVTSFNIKSRLA